jgi:hypothetical protein
LSLTNARYLIWRLAYIQADARSGRPIAAIQVAERTPTFHFARFLETNELLYFRRVAMKKLTAVAIAAIAMFMFTPQQAQAQFHRGFGGPGFGGSGFSISVGRGFGPGFGSFGNFGPGFGLNRGFGVGFVNPTIHRTVPFNSFYRGGFNQGFHGGFNRGGGFHYRGGGRRGCGW